MKKKILWAVIIILVVIQFIRPAKNQSNVIAANDITRHYTVPQEVQNILKRACNDCHSNNTEYPWYSRIQPVTWWLQHHVDEGKRELNFSEFAGYQPKRQYRKMEEVIDQVKKGEMPLASYLWIHKDAKLNKDEKETLLVWAGILADQIKAKYKLTK